MLSVREIEAMRQVLTVNRDIVDLFEKRGVRKVDLERVFFRAAVFFDLVSLLETAWEYRGTASDRPARVDQRVMEVLANAKDLLKREEA